MQNFNSIDTIEVFPKHCFLLDFLTRSSSIIIGISNSLLTTVVYTIIENEYSSILHCHDN
jgi:hypothetical protein